ncbi:MAG: hypothetical protein J0M26_10255 [Planctomycetes bacterium]|nr:hypothetical protein [Planctomycetota bacterium]
MTESGIVRCLARVGSTGWMGIFGSIHPISLGNGAAIAVATEFGEFAAEIAALLSQSSVESLPKNSFYAGEILRPLQESERELQRQHTLWCAEHMREIEIRIAEITPNLSLIDCEKSLCGQHLVLWFLGQATAELGPLSVALAERWQLSTVRFISPDGVRSLTEKKDINKEPLAGGTWLNVACEKVNSEIRFSKDAATLLQSHGVYQQKLRRTLTSHPHTWPQSTSAMIRIRKPGAFWTNLQIARLLEWAHRYGEGWLRPTTRQGWQIYGVPKPNIEPLLRELHEHLFTTQGTCGNHPRNITCCPLANQGDSLERYAYSLAAEIDRLLIPKCPSYEVIWLDAAPVDSVEEIAPAALPHKLKVGVTTATHCCTEVLSNDIAIVIYPSVSMGSQIRGDIYLGGGLAFRRDHPETFPQLATYACTVNAEDILPLVRGIEQAFHRWGTRRQRRMSRLKYWLNDIGIEELLRLSILEASRRVKLHLHPDQRVAFTETNHLGVHSYRDSTYIGLRWKAWGLDGNDEVLRRNLMTSEPSWLNRWYVSTQQEIIFGCFEPDTADSIPRQQKALGLTPYFYDFSCGGKAHTPSIRQHTLPQVLSCAALPTCSLALSDAEAHKAELMQWMMEFQATLNFESHSLSCRISGCGNNCSRPLLADIGLIAHGPNRYGVYVGGNHAQQQLAQYTGREFPWGTELKEYLHQLVRLQESGFRLQTSGIRNQVEPRKLNTEH